MLPPKTFLIAGGPSCAFTIVALELNCPVKRERDVSSHSGLLHRVPYTSLELQALSYVNLP